jgi:hypothetical protein
MSGPSDLRQFEIQSVWDQKLRKHVRVAKVRCSKCPAHELIRVAGRHKMLPTEALEGLIRQRGWRPGPTRKRDVCPICSSRRQAIEKPSARKDQPMSETELKLKAEPPRKPSRDDKRLIYAAIEDVWLGEDKGYQSGCSDQTVAKGLGVPRKWVEDVRTEMFGEVAGNEDIQALAAKLDTLRSELVAFQGRMMSELDKVERAAKPLLELVSR